MPANPFEPVKHVSTAKQRLWLACLGYAPIHCADNVSARACFEHASQTRLYQQPVNAGQVEMATTLGLDLANQRDCHGAAGLLYRVSMCAGWVYSVWRHLRQGSEGRYDTESLPYQYAVAIAKEMERLQLFSHIENAATTGASHGDVFFRMGSKQRAIAYIFVVDYLRSYGFLQ